MDSASLSHIFYQFKRGNLKPFYEMVYPGLLIFSARHLGEELGYLSEDVVQDAVYDSYQIRENFDSPLAWMGYLHKNILHGTIQFIRKHNSRLNYLEKKKEDDYVSGHDVEILEQEVMDMLYAAIHSLQPRYREVVRMSYIEKKKNAEIAAHFGVAEITVKKWKAAIIAALRDSMQDDDGSTGTGYNMLIAILIVSSMMNELQAMPQA